MNKENSPPISAASNNLEREINDEDGEFVGEDFREDNSSQATFFSAKESQSLETLVNSEGHVDYDDDDDDDGNEMPDWGDLDAQLNSVLLENEENEDEEETIRGKMNKKSPTTPLGQRLREKSWRIKEYLERLDGSINFHGDYKTSRGEREIILDFRLLLPQRSNTKADTPNQNGVVVQIENSTQPPVTTPAEAEGNKELSLVSELLKIKSTRDREKLLNHPLVVSFIHLSWKQFERFVWFSFVYYMTMACLLSLYIISVYVTLCPYKISPAEATATKNETEEERRTLIDNFGLMMSTQRIVALGSEEHECEFETGHWINYVGFLIMSLLVALKELRKMISLKSEYIRWRNAVEFVFTISASLLWFPACFVTSSFYSYIQYQMAACSIFTVWVCVLFQLGKFPTLSVYIEMFTRVLKSLGYFILTFGVLLIGFTLCTCVLFSNTNSHYTIVRSFLKVLAMSTGEYGYEDVLYSSEISEALQYPLLSHFFYMLFILVASIALMNLLIGLAVSDIEKARAIAEVTSLCHAVQQIERLEKYMFLESYIPPVLRCDWQYRSKKCVEIAKNRQLLNNNEKPEGGSRTFIFLPQNDEDTSLPFEIKQKALELAERNIFFSTGDVDENQIYSSSLALDFEREQQSPAEEAVARS